jgi:hypothetical protein
VGESSAIDGSSLREDMVEEYEAAMRKLVHLAYGVLKTEQPFNEKYTLGSWP